MVLECRLTAIVLDAEPSVYNGVDQRVERGPDLPGPPGRRRGQKISSRAENANDGKRTMKRLLARCVCLDCVVDRLDRVTAFRRPNRPR